MKVWEFPRPIPSPVHPPADRVSLGFILGDMTRTTLPGFSLHPSWHHYDIVTNSAMRSLVLEMLVKNTK